MAMKALVISAIVLVAVVMGFGVVASAIPLAHADHPCDGSEGGSPHACGNENRPTCDELKQQLEAKRVPPQAIEKFLEHCVD